MSIGGTTSIGEKRSPYAELYRNERLYNHEVRQVPCALPLITAYLPCHASIRRAHYLRIGKVFIVVPHPRRPGNEANTAILLNLSAVYGSCPELIHGDFHSSTEVLHSRLDSVKSLIAVPRKILGSSPILHQKSCAMGSSTTWNI